MENLKRKKLVVDLPTGLKNQIKEVFTSYTPEYQEKIEFVVWLINSNSNFQVNKANFNYMLSLRDTPNKLNKVTISHALNKLQEAGIIKQVGEAIKTRVSTTYSMTDKYKFKPKTGEEKTFYLVYDECPLFIQKFIVDGAVKKKEYSQWQPNLIVELINNDNTIIEYNEIEKLKAENKNYLNLIQELQSKIQDLEEKVSTFNSVPNVEKIEKVDELEEGEEAQVVYNELNQICKEAGIQLSTINFEFLNTLIDNLIDNDLKLKTEVLSIFSRENKK